MSVTELINLLKQMPKEFEVVYWDEYAFRTVENLYANELTKEVEIS